MKLHIKPKSSLIFSSLVSTLGGLGCASVYSNVPEDRAHLLTPADSTIEERPETADVVVQRQRLLAVDAKCAWDTLADIASWTAWDPHIRKTSWVEGNQAAVGAVFLQEFDDFTAQSRILAAERGKMLRWRGQDPDGTGPVGVHTWTFIPTQDGQTLVLNDEHFHGWYLQPLGWFTDFGVSEQFDETMVALERAAQARCQSSPK